MAADGTDSKVGNGGKGSEAAGANVGRPGLHGFTVAELHPQLKIINKAGGLAPYVAPGKELPQGLSSEISNIRAQAAMGTGLRVAGLMNQAQEEIDALSTENLYDFYQQELPLSGIQRCIRFDGFEGVKCEVLPTQNALKMSPSQEAVLAISKACELFVLELALRAWSSKELPTAGGATAAVAAGGAGGASPNELSREDVLRALIDTEQFDIFTGIVPPPVVTGAAAAAAAAVEAEGPAAAAAAAAGATEVTGGGEGEAASGSKRAAEGDGQRAAKKR